MEFVICCAAVVVALVAAQIGTKAGAADSLAWALVSLLSTLIALRYWFVFSRLMAGYEPAPLPILTAFAFWAIFIITAAVALKIHDVSVQTFEAVEFSLADRALGGVFGLVTGVVVVTTAMMTLSVVAPKVLPAYDPATLPLALDTAPVMAFRFVEQSLAGITTSDPSHTPLPRLRDANADEPLHFWE